MAVSTPPNSSVCRPRPLCVSNLADGKAPLRAGPKQRTNLFETATATASGEEDQLAAACASLERPALFFFWKRHHTWAELALPSRVHRDTCFKPHIIDHSKAIRVQDDTDGGTHDHCAVVWAKASHGVWGLCYVFEDTLTMTCNLMVGNICTQNVICRHQQANSGWSLPPNTFFFPSRVVPNRRGKKSSVTHFSPQGLWPCPLHVQIVSIPVSFGH